MVRRRSLGLAVLAALTLLPFAGCRQAAVRYNTRYTLLLEQGIPKTLPIPVDGVTAAKLQNTWGFARDGGRHHKGIDIFAPRNTPVRSVTAGLVEIKGMRGLGGQVVTITGPGGYRFYYAHLEDFGPQAVGDWVEPGEIIGYVGNSGNAAISSTHLHYGIYTPSGDAINPYPLLRGGQPFAMQVETQTASK
ncbi:MAG TPA: M23 family metallopeptidase [Thermoanaerobaculia bacterium]|jgi:murein DD-endopeptidase MepM/ murein hydrolase activator NlpD